MSLQNLYEYDPDQLKFILSDIRIVSFLYSYKMDSVLNTYLRSKDNTAQIVSLIQFLTSHRCELLTYYDESGIDKNLNYCIAFEMFMKKITLYVDTVALNMENFKKLIIPSFYKLLLKISTFFRIRKNITAYRVVVIDSDQDLDKDVGFLSVSLNPMAAMWIFGEHKVYSNTVKQNKSYKIYFYKIKIDKGTFCIPITSLGTINFDEQEILFTNYYTLKIEKCYQKKFYYEKAKLQLNKSDTQDFEDFLYEYQENIYHIDATLVKI